MWIVSWFSLQYDRIIYIVMRNRFFLFITSQCNKKKLWVSGMKSLTLSRIWSGQDRTFTAQIEIMMWHVGHPDKLLWFENRLFTIFTTRQFIPWFYNVNKLIFCMLCCHCITFHIITIQSNISFDNKTQKGKRAV